MLRVTGTVESVISVSPDILSRIRPILAKDRARSEGRTSIFKKLLNDSPQLPQIIGPFKERLGVTP